MSQRYAIVSVVVAVFVLAGCGGDKKSDTPSAAKKTADKTPAAKTPADKQPAGKSPVAKSPVAKSPVDKSPVDKSPADKSPADKPGGIAKAGASIEVTGFHGLHVPVGGKTRSPPHGGTKMVLYGYMKSRAELVKTQLGLLAAHKWAVKKQTKSPRGSVRLTVEKAGKTLSVRIAGSGPRSVLIITR